MSSKSMIVKARLNSEIAEKFHSVCTQEKKTSSSLLRELIECYLLNRNEALQQFDVEVKIGHPYGRGKQDRDEYKLSAYLIDKTERGPLEYIPFNLPEFRVGGIERYRVDSFYNYRERHESSVNDYGRLVGAKLVDGKWEGAIFLYSRIDIENTTPCFEDVKEKLRTEILSRVVEFEAKNNMRVACL